MKYWVAEVLCQRELERTVLLGCFLSPSPLADKTVSSHEELDEIWRWDEQEFRLVNSSQRIVRVFGIKPRSVNTLPSWLCYATTILESIETPFVITNDLHISEIYRGKVRFRLDDSNFRPMQLEHRHVQPVQGENWTGVIHLDRRKPDRGKLYAYADQATSQIVGPVTYDGKPIGEIVEEVKGTQLFSWRK